MLAIELSFTLLPFAGILLVTFIIGFLFRTQQIRNYKKKVIELEKEMLSNHAEILDLHKERASLLRQMKESKIPVIPMNTVKEGPDNKRQAR